MIMSSPHTILLVHVGPVQDFIASARRCRDLWFGSQLLSDASAEVARGLVKASGVNASQVLVFPGELRDGSSVANKIQLCLPTLPDDELRRVAEAGREALAAWLKARAQEVFADVERAVSHAEDFDRKRALGHVREMMEYMWAAASSDKGLEDATAYRATRQRAEALLAARKNTRDWNQTDGFGAGIPKSSLDGIRESVINERCHDRSTDWQLYKAFKVRRGERLCGIGLLKRLGEQDDRVPIFHSTSHMASLPVLAALGRSSQSDRLTDKLLNAFERLPDHLLSHYRIRVPRNPVYDCWDPRQPEPVHQPLHKGHRALYGSKTPDEVGYDGILLYESRAAARGPTSLLSYAQWSDDREREDASRAIQKVQREVLGKLGVKEMPAYYALLLADGDKMGVAIDALGSLEGHRKLSKQLDVAFASRCGEVIEAFGGSLIYAGGDDVLALLPLHTALAGARALRDLFADAMKPLFATAKDAPTLSVGLAVAHHQEPFGEVRELAKQAERLAKDAGRNRLAIALRKRGNAPLCISGGWDETVPLDRRLVRWGKLLSDDALPGRLAHRLLDVISPLEIAPRGDEPRELEAMCISLVKQVIARRALKDGALVKELEELYETAVLTQYELGDQGVTARLPAPVAAVHHMASELRIAEEFKRAWDIAYGKIDEAQEESA